MPIGTKQKKILVMEDDMAMREIVTRKLSNAGFAVRSAENGRIGFEIFLEYAPDIVILDLMMPEMDGFQVLSSIRDLPDAKLANIPVVVLSNLWSSEDMMKVKKLKANEYMVKAYFTPDEILAKINEVLNKVAGVNNSQ